ncbi:DUF5659 domain-containing protein [bacterium]|nr:DUF5659 domain-containing protein [bacterium]
MENEDSMKQNDLFITNDLGLSACLACYDYSIFCLDKKTDRGRVAFYFKKGDGLDDLIQGYWANTATVKPQIYFNAIKMLKNRIYSD